MLKNQIFFITFLVFLVNCSSEKTAWEKFLYSPDLLSAQEEISEELLSNHISRLSSDDFEGRKPATRGGKKTVNYLINEFKKTGLFPGNPNGKWTQTVDMLGVKSFLRTQFITDDERWVMKTGLDIIGNSYLKKKNINLEKVDLVFCGYGVSAPEYGWDDYKNMDVKGKVVVVLVNDPPVKDGENYDINMFKGKSMTYYGRWSYKYEEALRRGAVGAIVIHETESAGYPFGVLQSGHDSEHLTIENKNSLQFEGWIPVETAKRLFAMNGFTFSNMKKKALSPDFKPQILDVKFISRISNSFREVSSENVIAKLEGNDPILKDEYIIYTAHWDHLGYDNNLSGDKIYNGANDNASGTSMVLATAKAFAALKDSTRRSVLFLAVTAEEEGLLGAKYYNQNPLYPHNKTLAVINVDAMGNTFGRTKDIIIVGKGNSNIDQIVESAAKQDKKYVEADAEPEKGFFYRSDHFEFAKMGVPALYVDGGIDVRGKNKEFGKLKKNEYTDNHYHSISDEIMDEWVYDGMIEDNKILFRVGYAISQHDEWPTWNEGTEFKVVREAMQIK